MLYKFRGRRRIRGKKKNRTRKRFPDAAKFVFYVRPFISGGIRSFRHEESRNRDLLPLVHVHVLRKEQIGDEADADER